MESSYLLKETITFARACNSLVKLGPEAVKNGCKSFVGYRKKFWILRWHKTTCKPLKDVAAKPVMECSNIVAIELIKGKTVKEAVKKSHERADELMDELIYSKEPYASATLSALIRNDSILGFVGDGESKLN